MKKIYRIKALKLYFNDIKRDCLDDNGRFDYLGFIGFICFLILAFPLGLFLILELIKNITTILINGHCYRTAYPSSIKKDYSREAYHNMKEKYKLSIGYGTC